MGHRIVAGEKRLTGKGRRLKDEGERIEEGQTIKKNEQRGLVTLTFLQPSRFWTFLIMAEYVCKLGTDAGRIMTQTEEARSEEELRQRLRSEGYLVLSVRPKILLNFEFKSAPSTKIRPDDFLIFNQQFLTLSKSGLPLQKSLDLLAHQTRERGAADRHRGSP